MLPSFLRPARSRQRRDRSPFSSSYAPTVRSPDVSRNNTQRVRRRSSGRDHDNVITEEEDEDAESEVLDNEDDEDEDAEDEIEDEDEERSESDEDGPDDNTPLLPMFSPARLDSIPVFTLTHALRTLVTSKCDTVLTWEQLRSPQISQFLLKPIEQDIRNQHFNPATEYALMANCLQYTKEGAISSGNSGANKTRAMICELLCIKLLRDHSSRELIDALSYDFDPLQGYANAQDATNAGEQRHGDNPRKPIHRPARISCFEIAIRAQAKRFLAHPLVVTQLEAIWAGTIVFHSAADNMHRVVPFMRQQQQRSYGTNELGPSGRMSQGSGLPLRRAVTLYNPRDASLFKLSRLRVPRYRNILSTMSFAVLLSLFVAVLVQRSLEISTLEVVFWFWAAGYMLDEIVGFNEQGFSLYLASFWNTFDLGILLILMVHWALRIYGIVMPDVRKHTVANLAYDVLAADAILLFPRLFSVLDHYRYFSPLLIAFRYMAADLVAVSLLILISCSGFFVALTLSFGNDGVDTPSSVAYALLQMVMGFTPAAWDRWDSYNALGKFILTLFLFICHFLVVTILITVLTNSFMAIVRNAHDEHQFLFAVNTISHVKSDALFSYVAPTNILQWLLVPTRSFIPFRQYVKLNRTTIKVTHFPLLFVIYLYEKTVLQSTVFDSMDLVERRGRPRKSTTAKIARLNRAPSIATFRQDLALEEVFRRPFDSTIRGNQRGRNLRKSSNVVNTWMKDMGDDIASPPPEQDRQSVDHLEGKEATPRINSRMRRFSRLRDFSRRTMSVASDPEDFATNIDFLSPRPTPAVDNATPSVLEEVMHHTDADGDDELHTHDGADEDDAASSAHELPGDAQADNKSSGARESHDYFGTRKSQSVSTSESVAAFPAIAIATAKPIHLASDADSPSNLSPQRRPKHSRHVSTATTIFKPVADSGTDKSSSRGATVVHVSAPGSGARTPISKSVSHNAGHRTPRRAGLGPSRMRPLLPSRENPAFRSTPNLAGVVESRNKANQTKRRPSLEMDLVSDIGDNRAIGEGYVGAVPASFAAALAQGAGGARHAKEKEMKEEQEMFAKIMMARMNSLEEGFREVIHEMRESLRNDDNRSRSRGRPARPAIPKEKRTKEKDRERPTTSGGSKDTVDVQRIEKATQQGPSAELPSGSVGIETGKGQPDPPAEKTNVDATVHEE
ncbi:uncharacterized protein A1O9_10875 [Exophiala aquamarina CBS 119918]|uniref:Ion transport domain-containing protein n=1 Tax=Exophiala aquamarina CBS 119918 TaxID=1182545 RepID=A0A072P113_9EURO|nr:uncharacterized protein A1O9_10875 [Exophiala aquamarina CBS 119918]KEF52968.1 hypothetical protein A1O9_10875 [Exophiala aquamarina CBS 119918]